MSNITPIRQPMPQWGGEWPPDDPGQWVWDGTRWVCMPPPCPPPPCPPPPRPPQVCPVPPSAFSQIAKAQACYDQSQALRNLITQVVMDIFAQNPGIVPSPPPTAGSGPIIGVTDGSKAAPGEVGETLLNHVSGNWQAVVDAQVGTQSIAGIVLTPGDWAAQYIANVTHDETANAGLQGAFIELNPLPAGVTYNMMTGQLGGVTGSGAQATVASFNMSLTSLVTPISVSTPTLLSFSLSTFGQGTPGAAVSGTWTFDMIARRVR